MVSRKQLPERNDSAPPGGVLAPGNAVQLQWLQQVQDGTLSKSMLCLCVRGHPGTLAPVQLAKAAAGETSSRQGLRQHSEPAGMLPSAHLPTFPVTQAGEKP